MVEALLKYKKQLKDIDEQISNANDEFNVVNPFYGRGPKIEDIEYERTNSSLLWIHCTMHFCCIQEYDAT